MPLSSIQQMINMMMMICQGLDDVQGVAMPRNYMSANVKSGKATNLDEPLQNLTRSQKSLQVVHFDLFGSFKQASFAGHSYCCVFVDDHSRYTRYTRVYTVKNKSEVIENYKRFYADTDIIRSK
jgi:hypothetical protein